ncbi:MAG: hypothetical protein ACO206_09965, partial [Aquirufa sp.]
LDDGAEVLAFYATNKASVIKVGLYTPTNRKLVLNNASETAARAWLTEYGLVQKGFLPHYDLVFPVFSGRPAFRFRKAMA